MLCNIVFRGLREFTAVLACTLIENAGSRCQRTMQCGHQCRTLGLHLIDSHFIRLLALAEEICFAELI